MSFLQRIKQTLENRSIPQRGEFVTLHVRDVRELVHHFERLDADARLNHAETQPGIPEEERLHLFICALWRSGKISPETLKNTVIGTLAHLQTTEKYNKDLCRDLNDGTSDLKPAGLMSLMKAPKGARLD